MISTGLKKSISNKVDYTSLWSVNYPINKVGNWSLITVTSPLAQKILTTYPYTNDIKLVLYKNKVMFSIDYPDEVHEWDDSDTFLNIAGKYTLKTFMKKLLSREILRVNYKTLSTTELWNKYKLPLSVLNKFGYVTYPILDSQTIVQKSSMSNKNLKIWKKLINEAKEKGYRYNLKDRWERQ